jgi:hypothetical protein
VTLGRHWIYRVGAAAFLAAAGYHLTAVLVPRFGAYAYPSTYPLWRHLLFIAIDVAFSWLLLARVRWVIWPMALLTLQIYNGHGRYAWIAWSHESRIQWIDVVTTIGASVFLLLLIAARRYEATSTETA